MKTEIIFSGLIALIICSCTTQKFLPVSDHIDVSPYGSYIHIIGKKTSQIDGELISIDSNKITVLTRSSIKYVTVPIADIERFKLQYANPKNYAWTIPVFTLATLSHGVFLVITAPINLIVTIAVTAGGEKSFTYSEKNMTYDKLKMFARFPQGIPSGIDLTSIK